MLRDVSLERCIAARPWACSGPNGAGKTTCFYIITGLIAADAGQVLLGRPATSRALPMYRRARLGIGYLPQEASIFRGLNVEDNIRAVLEVAEPDRAAARGTLERLLGEFALAQLRRAPALALSGGERRRVEIARALAASPSFILLDEPLAGIDPINVGEIRDLVGHLKDRGLGVLITDHNVRDTLDIIDRAYILHDGAVLREGTPAEIVADRGGPPGLSRRAVQPLGAGMSFAPGIRLELRQQQSLVLTPQLQQAIRLLQMSNLELASAIDQEVAENPFLQRSDAEAAPRRRAAATASRRAQRAPRRAGAGIGAGGRAAVPRRPTARCRSSARPARRSRTTGSRSRIG